MTHSLLLDCCCWFKNIISSSQKFGLRSYLIMKWHQARPSGIYCVSLKDRLVLCQLSYFSSLFCFLGAVESASPRGSPRQSTHPPGKKDGACHLLVCSKGEMIFEHPAKCECSLLSCTAVRCDHCYFGCLSKEGVNMVSPPLRVVKKGTLHLASLCKSDYWHRNSRLCGGNIKRGQKMHIFPSNQHDGVLWSVSCCRLGMWSAHSTCRQRWPCYLHSSVLMH